jgi:hypothetical protein
MSAAASRGSKLKAIQAAVTVEERGDSIEKLRLNPTMNQTLHKPPGIAGQDGQHETRHDTPVYGKGGRL